MITKNDIKEILEARKKNWCFHKNTVIITELNVFPYGDNITYTYCPNCEQKISGEWFK